MCNAYKHPSGCSCGFGPPYEQIEVSIVKLPSPTDLRTRRAADLSVKFPAAHAIGIEHLNRLSTVRVREAARKTLQNLADRRFGKSKIKINVERVVTGSIEFDIVLMTGTGVAVYKFFKDYEQLRKSMIIFCKDIHHAARYLCRVIKKAIVFDDEGSSKKPPRRKRKKKNSAK